MTIRYEKLIHLIAVFFRTIKNFNIQASKPYLKPKEKLKRKRLLYLKQLSHQIRIILNLLLESSGVYSRPIWIEAQIIRRSTEIV